MNLRSLCVLLLLISYSAVNVSAQYPMDGIELHSVVSLSQMGGGSGKDIWGWTDSQSGREFALMGRSQGTTFVEVTDPDNPVVISRLPTATSNSTWRDIKVYNDHAFVVADNAGPHGMQVFDLTRLLEPMVPAIVDADATWDQTGFRNAHNIAINEDSGFAYIVGASRTAGGGLYMVDISNPTSPTVAGEFSADGYTHDTQVVNYIGPDPDYAGKEIAFNSNEDTLTIVDVTDKSNPSQVAREGYPDVGYAHQGWLSEDQEYFFMNDELDELTSPSGHTRTHIWDVKDLDHPDYRGFWEGQVASSDHNLYVQDNLIYAANYRSGLRVLEIVDPAAEDIQDTLTEVAWLDTAPGFVGTGFDGAWSVYPYFDSGTIIVSDTDAGLFVARLESSLPDADFNDDGSIDCADVDALTAEIAAGSVSADFDLTGDGNVNGDDLTEWLVQGGAANLPSGNPYLEGDANLDGTVDGLDFIAWNDNKFTSVAAWCSGDFNAEGTVDGLDYILWNGNKFTSSDSVSAVPEPGMGVFLMAALVSLAVARRH